MNVQQNQPFQVQTLQLIEGAPGYGEGFRTVGEYSDLVEAEQHADWLVTQSKRLDIRIRNTQFGRVWDKRIEGRTGPGATYPTELVRAESTMNAADLRLRTAANTAQTLVAMSMIVSFPIHTAIRNLDGVDNGKGAYRFPDGSALTLVRDGLNLLPVEYIGG